MTKANKKKQQTTFLLVLCVLICPFVFRYMGIGSFLTSSVGMIFTFVSLLLFGWYLNGKSFQVQDVEFVHTYFPDMNI